jgi:chemotaxis protein MotB
MGKRKKKAEEHVHAESWLVSYCDMISLLVTFFLMMMTFSSKHDGNLEKIGVGVLQGAGGVFEGPKVLPMGERIDPGEIELLAEGLRAYLEQRGSDETASVRQMPDGLAIGFDLDSSFAPGSADPTPALVANLRELSPVLARWTRLVIVEGFAEGNFVPSVSHADADALGLSRAAAAAQVLLESAELSPSRIQITSHGTRRPRALETSDIGVASNRRVEIRIVSLAAQRPPLGSRS